MNDIIVGVDQSATARRAAEKAVDLAAAYGENLHIVWCIPRKGGQMVGSGNDQWYADPTAEAEAFLDNLRYELPYDKVTTQIVHGSVASALCEEAERLDAKIIVVGNRRVQGVSRVLGSIAGDVLKHAPCDVLIANTTGD
jgi:nucleotide-binding universal stress UspA family protein